MDMKLFTSDEIKSFVLLVVLGGPIFYVIMLVIEWGGDLFFIWLLIVTLLILVVFKHLYLNFIMPCFNKLTEMNQSEHPKLYERIKCLADHAKFPLSKIYIVD